MPHGLRQRTDERGNALARLRQQLRIAVEQNDGIVVGLPYDRRKRGTHQRCGGLIDETDQPRPENLERDRIHGRHPSPPRWISTLRSPSTSTSASTGTT